MVKAFSPMPEYKSSLEKKYACLLQLRLLASEICRWAYEPIGFKNAKRTFYYPDFMVVSIDGVEFHEVKGWDRQGKGKLKWKTTAEKYPEFIWKFITWEKNHWKTLVYLP